MSTPKKRTKAVKKKFIARTNDTIVESVRDALIQVKGDWGRLEKVSKGKLSYRWIVAFSSGEIRDPSFTMLRKVASYLGIKFKMAPGVHFAKFKPES